MLPYRPTTTTTSLFRHSRTKRLTICPSLFIQVADMRGPFIRTVNPLACQLLRHPAGLGRDLRRDIANDTPTAGSYDRSSINADVVQQWLLPNISVLRGQVNSKLVAPSKMKVLLARSSRKWLLDVDYLQEGYISEQNGRRSLLGCAFTRWQVHRVTSFRLPVADLMRR